MYIEFAGKERADKENTSEEISSKVMAGKKNAVWNVLERK